MLARARERAKSATAQPSVSEHDRIAHEMRAIENGVPSPCKAKSRKAGVPLQVLLEQVLTNPEAAKAAAKAHRATGAGVADAPAPAYGVKRSEAAAGVASVAPLAVRRPRSGPAARRPSTSSSASSTASSTAPSVRSATGMPAHLRKDVLDLFAAHASATAPQRRPSGSAMPPSVVESTKSFKELLRSYYPRSTSAEIEAMHAVAAPREGELARRRWVERTKEVHGEEIEKFFGKFDADGSGGISLAEFGEAVGELGLGGAETLALFREADADANGVLDLHEFAELCACHPPLLDSFGDLLKLGAEKAAKAEEKRLDALFRNKMKSPTRGMRRPSLVDLRRAHEVSMPTGWSPASK